jgi:hypothetical protein
MNKDKPERGCRICFQPVYHDTRCLFAKGLDFPVLDSERVPAEPAESGRVCVECGHNDGVDRGGQCVHRLDVPAENVAVWDDNHCGHRCQFPESEQIERHGFVQTFNKWCGYEVEYDVPCGELPDAAIHIPAEPPRSPCHNMPVIAGHCILCKQLAEPVPAPQADEPLDSQAFDAALDQLGHALSSITSDPSLNTPSFLIKEVWAAFWKAEARLRQIEAATLTPPSVESVLAELRERFPDKCLYIEINKWRVPSQESDENRAWISIADDVAESTNKDMDFAGATLTEALQAVREWAAKENQP